MQGSTHPCFQKFIKKSSTEAYIDGLCKALKSLDIGAPSKPACSKRKLIELLEDSESSEEEQVPECSKSKRYLYCDSDIEDDMTSTLRRTSISDEVFEPLEAE